MEARITKEYPNVYLYELTQERFKEIRSTVKIYNNNKAVAVRGDNGKAIYVSPHESAIFKGKYIWLSTRNKEYAANIFKVKTEKELLKKLETIKELQGQSIMLNKYFNTRQKAKNK